MDFSFIVVIGLSAILTSVLMIFSEATSRWRSTLRLAFGVSYFVALVLMQPWHIASAKEAVMSVMMLLFMTLWVAIGCIIGMVLNALALSAIKWPADIYKRPT